MDIQDYLKTKIQSALIPLGLKLDLASIIIETTKDKNHGDYATNVCLKFAKTIGLTPIAFAHKLSALLIDETIASCQIAGPGFLNIFIHQDKLSQILVRIDQEKEKFGLSTIGQGKTINIEFVSANPTGPMHLAHARAAALGDVISTLLTATGYKVTKEFYVNDAGAQINNLAKSIYQRYLELFGKPFTIPEDGYFGQDIKEIASELKQAYGDQLIGHYDEAFFKKIGIEKQLERIKVDLKRLGVYFDVFRSEQAIRDEGTIETTLKALTPFTYTLEGATYLKTTDFFDDKDRVIIKSDGQFTYFLPDIAYHLDKLKRESRSLIDILGPDHHGYINRMRSALKMLGYDDNTLEVLVMQLVTLTKDGVEVKMSKRTGVGVTLKELVEEVGKDAARYFIVARAINNPIEFDISLAQTKSNINPLYYAQYAHARLSSLIKTGTPLGFDYQGSNLQSVEETDLLKHLASFPKEVIASAESRDPSRIANFIQKLASYTHSFYTNRRVIDHDQVAISQSRLALCKASQIVFKNAFSLLGIEALESM
jgi:arginyl-tRNA synthetase